MRGTCKKYGHALQSQSNEQWQMSQSRWHEHRATNRARQIRHQASTERTNDRLARAKGPRGLQAMAGVGWTRTHCQINRPTPLEAQPAMDSLWHHPCPFKVTLNGVGARASRGLDNTKQNLLRELGYDPWCVVGGMRQLSPPSCVRSIPHTP